jgi:hypothetical protein
MQIQSNNPEELKHEVENYATIKFSQSARGQVIFFFCFILLLSIVLSFFGLAILSDILLSLVVYIPILYFVFRGHRWAIISLMALWSFEKFVTANTAIQTGGNVISSVIWWTIGISFLYRALEVENIRRKSKPEVLAPTKPIPFEEMLTGKNTKKFCGHCGSAVSHEKFCSNCGTAT